MHCLPFARYQQVRSEARRRIGHRAGSAPGYDYSAALRKAGLIWSTDNLNRWLVGPQQFIPGVKMPVRVPDPIARRDIVAYLQQESKQRGSELKAKNAAQGPDY